MNDGWTRIFKMLYKTNQLEAFIGVLREQALFSGGVAAQVGQSSEARNDALADIRFCLSKSNEAQKALMAMREEANFRDAGGFQEGGSALA